MLAYWRNAVDDHDPKQPDESLAMLESMRARLRQLTIAVVLLALAVLLCGAAVFGFLTNYFGGDATLRGSIAGGAALLGFFFGLFAGRRR